MMEIDSAFMADNEERELEEPSGKVRLFVEAALAAGTSIEPSPQQAHYLLHVMRAGTGDRLRLFNGTDGEWLCEIAGASRRACQIACIRKIAPQSDTPDVWLLCAPIKKTPADYVTQKATELGVRVLQPVLTRRTIVHRVNLERMRANAIEASEQSGRLTVPEVREPLGLANLLSAWPADRRLLFCDEMGGPPIAQTLRDARKGAWAVLTGPEGGFDAEERALIRACPQALPVSLGSRILRADTAALAALSVWQALCGDWR
jgi:16S rRNA (uracil1498-N3)-methyltransferase